MRTVARRLAIPLLAAALLIPATAAPALGYADANRFNVQLSSTNTGCGTPNTLDAFVTDENGAPANGVPVEFRQVNDPNGNKGDTPPTPSQSPTAAGHANSTYTYSCEHRGARVYRACVEDDDNPNSQRACDTIVVHPHGGTSGVVVPPVPVSRDATGPAEPVAIPATQPNVAPAQAPRAPSVPVALNVLLVVASVAAVMGLRRFRLPDWANATS